MSLVHKLQRLEQVILRARAHFDIWWVCEGSETPPQLRAIMNGYSEFFPINGHAHQFAYVVYLWQILDKRSKMVDLRALVEEAKAAGYPQGAIANTRALISQMEPIWRKLVLIRNNVFAHRSDRLSWEQVFHRADVTPNQIRTYMEQALQAVHGLLGATRAHRNHFSGLPAEHLLRMLSVLETAS